MSTAQVVTAIMSIAAILLSGAINLRVSLQTRAAANHSWIRGSRRDDYGSFLAAAQELHIRCEECLSEGDANVRSRETIDGFIRFFNTYSVVQAVADTDVVATARVYAYRLLELREVLLARTEVDRQLFVQVSVLLRVARHDVIDAMRRDLGLATPARPMVDFNPFAATDLATYWINHLEVVAHKSSRTSVGTKRTTPK